MRSMRHIPPYAQHYRFVVGPQNREERIIDYYTRRFSFKPREFWEAMMADGKITVNYGQVAANYVLKENDVIRTQRNDVQEPDVNAGYEILHDDRGVFVVNKPAPLPVHPAGRYFKNSLLHILREDFPDRAFHTIHRLDTWTTGVLVLATETERAKFLHRQVEDKSMSKVYGVMAVGDFGNKEFVVDVPTGRISGVQRGFGSDVREPKESVTRFTPLAKKDGLTLLRAEPVTGRTNQIRLHIKAAGGHILNDPLYAPNPTEDVPFMGLHCRSMSFYVEPGDQRTTFTAPWPGHYFTYFCQRELQQIEQILS